MPRKQRQPKTRTVRSHLSLPLHYLLMMGAPAATRIAGWVDLAQCVDVDACVLDAWSAHGEALRAEAEASGFVPWAARRRRPRAAALRWAGTFAEAHRY